MFYFRHNDWEDRIKLSPDLPAVISVENPEKLWQYAAELIKADEGEETNFILLDEKFAGLSLAKNCTVITDIPGLVLNSKKLSAALYKKCSVIAAESEYEMQIRTIIEKLYLLCKDISLSVGYDTQLHEDYELVDLFKLFSLSVNENYKTLAEKLIAFVNINIELLHTRIFVFVFLAKFLSQDDLQSFLRHCEREDVCVLLVEDRYPEIAGKLKIGGLIIDGDLCEILKENFLNSGE